MIHRNESPDDWLTAAEAAIIISKNSNKQVKPNYMGQLVRLGKIKPYKLSGNLNMFRRGDVEKIIVGKRGRRPDSVKSKEKMQDADNAA